MTKPVTIPNTFATATTAIPLSNLDADFSTVATAMNDANTYSNYAPDTGSANAYVVTLTGVSTLYSAGLRIQFKAGNANTTASTLNVNGQGAKNITYQDASAIASGTIAANAIVDVMYDGTQFLLMNDPAGATGGDVVGPAGATANAAAIFDSTTGKLIKDSKVIITPVANSSTLTIANNKTVTVNNTLTLSGTDSTTMTFPSTSATIARTDSAQTFTGVQTFSSNPVLSGGTANGVLYLNGSSVATSGSALTYNGSTLTLNTLTSNLQGVLVSNGTAYSALYVTGTGYSYAGAGANESWFYAGNALNIGSDGNLPIKFLSNGSEQMRLTSTGLGIGTSSPSYKLDVAGIGRLTTAVNSNATSLILNNSNTAAGGVGVSIDGYSGNTSNKLAQIIFGGAGATGGNIDFLTSANGSSYVDRMRLTSSGNLGIGTSSITNPYSQSNFTDVNIDGVWGGVISFKLGGSEKGWIGQRNSGNADMVVAASTSQSLLFATNGNNERARITSGGDFCVGTASTTNASLINWYKASGTIETSLGGVTTAQNHIVFANPNGNVGSIQVDGSATSYNTTSDYRLKDNPQPLTGSGAFIDALKPKTWNWKADGSRGVGFIAHEVQEVSPGSVVGEKDGEQMQAMEYGSAEFIANIIAELQSLRQRVALLEGN